VQEVCSCSLNHLKTKGNQLTLSAR
jgi:hypothetical protein